MSKRGRTERDYGREEDVEEQWGRKEDYGNEEERRKRNRKSSQDEEGAPRRTGSEASGDGVDEGKEEPPPEEPNYEPSGLLAKETNVRNGITLKYTVPPESRLPTKKWRFYVFKDDDEKEKEVHYLHRQATYLFGKDEKVADIVTRHPTCSKQHAVVQYRLVGTDVVPYLMDLESTNGTVLNDKKIEPCRYVELREQDVIRFGRSSRDYVLMQA